MTLAQLCLLLDVESDTDAPAKAEEPAGDLVSLAMMTGMRIGG